MALENIPAIATSGSRAVRTLPFSQETFRKIADRFFLHGSISKVINRADVPIFTHASLDMGCRDSSQIFPAYGEGRDQLRGLATVSMLTRPLPSVYSCRSTNVWDLDLALSVTYFPHCRLTFGVLYGCPRAIEREVIDRLKLTDESAWCHPLLLPGIFAELERCRHLKVVEQNIDDLEGEIFQLDFQPSIKEKIHNKDSSTRNAEKKKAWLDTTYLRNGLVSWKTQLTKMAEHCDDLPQVLFNEQAFMLPREAAMPEPTENVAAKKTAQRAVELQQLQKITRLVRDRIHAIVDEYEDKIRDTTVRVDGMAMATQWASIHLQLWT